ncbi:uncharacterized protein LOC131537475 isoform X4 [Onychostoma macrolepis]|uniref:uncharacterized protein LOC131537475 isoform X4 n=1 Tax=Onychostoma macrolepis TaxID=369639 RepID=UPI00272B959D|nr:uncharacterized protein LOC131537475 isoform X4 [Onychostoma macrolepis]
MLSSISPPSAPSDPPALSPSVGPQMSAATPSTSWLLPPSTPPCVVSTGMLWTCAHTPANTMGSLRFPAFLQVLLYTMVVQITAEAIQMGMFPEAADYSFQNCRKEMLQMVTKSGGLLQTELNNNPDFKTVWKGNAACKKDIPGGTPEHMAALKSYAEASYTFHGRFKKLLQTSRGSSTYRDGFPFKSLFFLLTDAMQLIGKSRTVYSGTEKEYSTEIGEKVRFESFLPAQRLYSAATEDFF